MRKRFFWALFGWSIGVLASNWMGNRLRGSIKKHVIKGVSSFTEPSNDLFEKGNKAIKKFQNTFGTPNVDKFSQKLRDSTFRPRHQGSNLHGHYRPMKP